MFPSKAPNNEIKSMKRYMKRKLENDDLSKRVRVPLKYWTSALRRSDLKNICTLIGEPKNIGTPLQYEFSSKKRVYIKRPISPTVNKGMLHINRIIYNTEIVVYEEFLNEEELDDGSSSFSTNNQLQKYEFYSVSNVDKLSEDTNSIQNSPKKRPSVALGKIPGFNLSQEFIKSKTVAMKSKNIEESDSDNGELHLDGDYVIRKALLKDHNIGELSRKEMQYCIHT